MKYIIKEYMQIPAGLKKIVMVDIFYTLDEGSKKFAYTIPLYQDTETKEYVVYFEPSETSLLVARNHDFQEVRQDLKRKIIKFYRNKK